MPLAWEADLPPAVPYSCPIFTSYRDFDYRDGILGLDGLELRLEAAGGGSTPAKERFSGRKTSGRSTLAVLRLSSCDTEGYTNPRIGFHVLMA